MVGAAGAGAGNVAAVGGVRRGTRRGGRREMLRQGAACVQAGAVVGSDRAFAARARKETRAKQAELMRRLLKGYDADSSGALDRTELQRMLRDYTEFTFQRREGPSEEDLDFLMDCCDVNDSGTVEIGELWVLIDLWCALMQEGARARTLLSRYDLDQGGQIDASELRLLLRELNSGLEVPEEVVRWVMAVGDRDGDGSLGCLELARAVAAWYVKVDEAVVAVASCGKEDPPAHAQKPPQRPTGRATGNGRSSFCVIS